jgi:hypothetical protein
MLHNIGSSGAKTLIHYVLVLLLDIQLEPSADMGLEIGKKVKVSRLRDRVSKDVAAYLGKRGIVSQFKMVDGSGVGVVVEFEDSYTTWFFEDELSEIQ